MEGWSEERTKARVGRRREKRMEWKDRESKGALPRKKEGRGRGTGEKNRRERRRRERMANAPPRERASGPCLARKRMLRKFRSARWSAARKKRVSSVRAALAFARAETVASSGRKPRAIRRGTLSTRTERRRSCGDYWLVRS